MPAYNLLECQLVGICPTKPKSTACLLHFQALNAAIGQLNQHQQHAVLVVFPLHAHRIAAQPIGVEGHLLTLQVEDYHLKGL